MSITKWKKPHPWWKWGGGTSEERVRVLRGGKAIKHFPLKKKRGKRRRQWQPSRQDVLLPGDTIAIRHCVGVYVSVCVNSTSASVALSGEIVNCCGQVTRRLRVRQWWPPETIPVWFYACRQAKPPLKHFRVANVFVTEHTVSLIDTASIKERSAVWNRTSPYYLTRAVSLRHDLS